MSYMCYFHSNFTELKAHPCLKFNSEIQLYKNTHIHSLHSFNIPHNREHYLTEANDLEFNPLCSINLVVEWVTGLHLCPAYLMHWELAQILENYKLVKPVSLSSPWQVSDSRIIKQTSLMYFSRKLLGAKRRGRQYKRNLSCVQSFLRLITMFLLPLCKN